MDIPKEYRRHAAGSVARLTDHRHPALGFTLPVPADWKRLEDQGAVLIVVEPSTGRSFLPNVVVTVGELAAGVSPEQWLERSVQLLSERLDSYWSIDQDVTEVDGQKVCRTLGHHTVPAGAVTVEQWSRFTSTHSYTVTASVGTLQYPAYCELFAKMAAGFRPPGEAR